jgi:hypothetical protein
MGRKGGGGLTFLKWESEDAYSVETYEYGKNELVVRRIFSNLLGHSRED